jgi:hypothetical protein
MTLTARREGLRGPGSGKSLLEQQPTFPGGIEQHEPARLVAERAHGRERAEKALLLIRDRAVFAADERAIHIDESHRLAGDVHLAAVAIATGITGNLHLIEELERRPPRPHGVVVDQYDGPPRARQLRRGGRPCGRRMASGDDEKTD